MRHTVTVPDEIGRDIQKIADEEGISISEFYARAAERELKRRRREKAFHVIDEMIGNTDIDCEGAERTIRRSRTDRL